MQKIRTTTNSLFERNRYATGATLELEDAQADDLVTQGVAEVVKAERPATPAAEEPTESEPTVSKEPAEQSFEAKPVEKRLSKMNRTQLKAVAAEVGAENTEQCETVTDLSKAIKDRWNV